eukprot:358587-Chlamydomonas_euryale.AAC.6
MDWKPTAAAIPTGFMFPSVNGSARVDTLWEVPSQWDVLHTDCYADLEKSHEAAGDGAGGAALLSESAARPCPLPRLSSAQSAA